MLTKLINYVPTYDKKMLKTYQKMVDQINQLEESISALSDQELQNKTAQFKQSLTNGQTLDEIKIQAFAVVREASKRVLGLRHYDVQLVGGMVLTDGQIAEMPTGEGKTLVASLPSYLRALEEKGVHVITVNEYLARRDREQIGKVHEFLGLKVGLNIPNLSASEKKEAYNADITYGVGNEFGFDYLRDNMVIDQSEKVQRPFHYAIIDEIDSVLIDEAKTPLIIAGKTNVNPNLYRICSKLAKGLKKDKDYTYDPLTKSTSLTDDGITKVERAFGIDNLFDLEHQTLNHFVLQAIRAHVMFELDVDYIVTNKGEIALVDMFTGRVMDGRTFSNGLHQALEAKENLGITEENKTQAMITIQNYYRLYPLLAGMTGTAKTEEKEFQSLYNLHVIQIPTNRIIKRNDYAPLLFKTKAQKYKAVAEEVARRHQTGQPVLIGTTSIIQSEEMARYLDELNIPYSLLNAKSVENEVEMIKAAGQKGYVTIATNMAGRGTDITLGDGVDQLGGLLVIGTERHESRRIDNQLKGRSGRQGDPGESQMMTSLEDDLIQRFANEELEKIEGKIQADANGLVTSKEGYTLVDKAQKFCENQNFSVREYTLKLDDIVNEQRTVIYKLRNRILSEEGLLELTIPLIHSTAMNLFDQICPDYLLPEEWDIEQFIEQLEKIHISINPSSYVDLERKEMKELITEETDRYVTHVKEVLSSDEMMLHLKQILLLSLDFHWLQHIEDMDRLKEGISLRSYSQEDPLRIYQREGYELFQSMYQSFEHGVSTRLANVIRNQTTNIE